MEADSRDEFLNMSIALYNKYQIERRAWILGLEEAEKRGFLFYKETVMWAKNQLDTYLKYNKNG